MFKHILIPTDGSQTALKAVRAGVTLAAETGAKVTAYCAQEPVPTRIYGEGNLANKALVARFEEHAAEYAKQSVKAVQDEARAAGVTCSVLITKIRPALPRHRRRGGKEGLRRDLHGLARPPRTEEAAARQRDQRSPDAYQDPGAGL
jgi:nucleotide-binding universal stress UspA family protein